MLSRFLRDRCAATAIEYCLIAGFIALAVVAGSTVIGTKLSAHYYGPVASGLT